MNSGGRIPFFDWEAATWAASYIVLSCIRIMGINQSFSECSFPPAKMMYA